MIRTKPGLSVLSLAFYAFRCAGEFDKHFDNVIKILYATLPLDPLFPVLVADAPKPMNATADIRMAYPHPKSATNTYALFARAVVQLAS